MPRLLSVWASLVIATSLATAQGPSLGELSRRLRAPKLSDTERAEVVEGLLGHGTKGAHVVARKLSADGKAQASKFEKARKSFFKSFDKLARKLIKDRSKGKQQEIESLRSVVMKNARNRSLDKSTIRGESDPAVARLRELLAVESDDVLHEHDELLASLDKTEELLDELEELGYLWGETESVLTSSDGPDRVIAKLKAPANAEALRKTLYDDLKFHALLATPMSSGDAELFQWHRTLTEELDDAEREGVRTLNHLLVVLGRPALKVDPKLVIAARDHSKDMERLNFFSHTSPVPGKRSFGQRASKAGTSASSENIARGQRTGRGAIRGWWYSPGHHRNMLGSHRRVGLGRDEGTWTQLFGG